MSSIPFEKHTSVLVSAGLLIGDESNKDAALELDCIKSKNYIRNADKKIRDKWIHSFVGLPEKEAILLAKESCFTPRITSRDGISLGVNEDLRQDRLNFGINNGIVEHVRIY